MPEKVEKPAKNQMVLLDNKELWCYNLNHSRSDVRRKTLYCTLDRFVAFFHIVSQKKNRRYYSYGKETKISSCVLGGGMYRNL
ncbi:hypothetical protein FYJ34_09535 [Clostridiaceae bacterium 68-1-5]|uniref:Uncharacterized protein n=1 Tax=Suipraeoptans intestinalis TaxID=2606628 RepID=A0A6N7V2Z5_9FIRM|nr:hypothetical protein [Suipraeoptans intestinalis]MDD7769631.1 hypothetical protein [Suipraeoptans intestinalis]MSR94490.1 hypothetical protein [Suipraeoptans intestinalis]